MPSLTVPLETLADLPIPLLLLDPAGRIIFESREFMRLAGIPDDTQSVAFGRPVADLPNMQTPEIQTLIRKVLAGDPIPGVPVDFTTLRGAKLSVSVIAGPLGDGSGFWIALRDLAEGDRLAGRLLQAQRMEFMGVAVAGVIHDLNNILTGLGGTLELLQDGKAAGAPLLSSLATLLRRSRDLTRRLLEAARPDTRGAEPLDLRTPVRQAADLMRNSLGDGVDVQVRLPERQVPVHADRTELVRSLFNLAINARDALAGERGSLHLELDVVSDPARCRSRRWIGSRCARVRVWDTGPGIAPDTAARIFEPFFSTKGPQEGTGMGLSVVHRVVIAHQGTLEYVDAPDRGACFDIHLPLFQGNVDDDEPTRVLAVPGHPSVGRRALEGLRILVADDEPTLRLLLEQALGLRGAEVVTVADGIDAMAALEEASPRFHVAVIDYHMPGGGLEALRRAREIDSKLHIVLCSGMDPGPDLTERFAELGVEFLPKPFRLGEAVDAIRLR